jgi:hypothetical protein
MTVLITRDGEAFAERATPLLQSQVGNDVLAAVLAAIRPSTS